MKGFDAMTLEEKYQNQLAALAEFPVWLMQQIKSFLHLDFDTVQKFVDAKLLYKFNVGRCTFYSTANKKYTNLAILKSCMTIDITYRMDYSKYEEVLHLDNTLEDKSLISRNVRAVGWLDMPRRYYLYHVVCPQPIKTVKDFQKIEKLLLDIHAANLKSDYISVVFFVRGTDIDALTDYLNKTRMLELYRVCDYILYRFISDDRPNFNYLKI